MVELNETRSENHSAHVQEIVGKMPNWILLWGTVIIFFALITICVLSYFIKYPETVSFPIIISKNSNPSNLYLESLPIIGYGKISQRNFLDVKVGQEAWIELVSYPKARYGVLTGKVDFISDTLSGDSTFHLTIKFPTQLLTNKHHLIIYKKGMVANGKLVIRKTSLLERLLRFN